MAIDTPYHEQVLMHPQGGDEKSCRDKTRLERKRGTPAEEGRHIKSEPKTVRPPTRAEGERLRNGGASA